MTKFIESIKIENGIAHLLDLHQKRVDQTLDHFYKGSEYFSLSDALNKLQPLPDTISKCRIVYSDHIEQIEIAPYCKRSIKKLTIWENDTIDYTFKYLDRSQLTESISKTANPEEEIIIIKNGFVTDCSYANLVFENDEGFFTPSTYLLNGVKRQTLLTKGIIQEISITKSDLSRFQRIHLINAMLELGDVVVTCPAAR